MLQDLLRRIVAQLVHHVVRVGADHRHRFQILLERQQVLVILQQHDPFAARAQSQILIRLRVHDLDGVVHIDIGILEEAQAELLLQNSAQRAIHQRHGDSPLLHALDQGPHVGGLVGYVQIDSGPQAQQSGFLLRGNDVLIEQGPEAAALALDDSFETNLLPQYIVHPLHRGVRRHILDFRVTRHHTQAPGFGDRPDPGRHKVLAQGTVRYLNRSALEAARRVRFAWENPSARR